VAKEKFHEILWLPEPEEHDYPAAESYLTLLFGPERAKEMVVALRAAPVVQFKAKDVFRASRLSLVGISNSHVVKNIRKIQKGAALSPILLVRNTENCRTVVGDGYHRMCAIYAFNEDAWIPCKLI